MKISEEIKIINGSPLEGVNPLPKFRNRTPSIPNTSDDFKEELKVGLCNITRVLPYTSQDRYKRHHTPLKLKCFVLENEYLRAEFLPEYGGRLHSLYDKVAKQDLLFVNPVIQPCNLAIRNAWLSGGIEWNIGNVGHTFTTCDNVYSAILKDGEGNDFLRIYEFERQKSIFWQVDFHLPDGSRELIVHVKLINPYEEDTTVYWWSNVAVKEPGDTRILASGDNIISFIGGKMYYEKLPFIQAMPGADVTYPSNATRSFDFFIQPNKTDDCTWEASAYTDGLTLFERSTPPLSCKKLFCWGNHRAGKHWQEYLSIDGDGYYAEIQAGIAPSQLHEKNFKGNSCYEWTQCFGGIMGDREKLTNPDYYKSRDYLASLIDERISTKSILDLDKKLALLADKEVKTDEIRHTGSGFSALEVLRIKKLNDGEIPKSMNFPTFTIGKEEYPFVNLLYKGFLPDENIEFFTPSYTVSNKWIELIEKSLEKEEWRNWYSLMQYGVAVYDSVNTCDFCKFTVTEDDNEKRTEIAESVWKESISKHPTYLVYRNLGMLEWQRGNLDKAEEYYDSAIKCHFAFSDFALASEYMELLLKLGKKQKVWDLYVSLPENCKVADRVKIFTAKSAVALGKLDYLEQFFSEEHYDIREGECSLTDIWFEFCARKIARERGIVELSEEKLNELISEAWETCPPDPKIDFRMSTDKKLKYRVQ